MGQLFDRIMKDYRPDSLWFDWQDGIPTDCQAEHFHEDPSFGGGYNATQQAILDTLRRHNPNLFVEMRWPFANLNNKPYVQLWQPLDSPSNFESMRLQAMIMRPFSQGIVIGTDEMYWNPELPDAEAARYMAAVVFSGVPYFGPNLLKEPPARLDMLKAWLRFYQIHKADLVNGTFEPFGDLNRPDQVIETSHKAFIYYGHRRDSVVTLRRQPSRIYIANASSSPGIELYLSDLLPGAYRVEISNLLLQSRRKGLLTVTDSMTRVEFDVPVGCILTLARR